MDKLLKDLKAGQLERLNKKEIVSGLNDIKAILDDMAIQRTVVIEIQDLLKKQLKVFKNTNERTH